MKKVGDSRCPKLLAEAAAAVALAAARSDDAVKLDDVVSSLTDEETDPKTDFPEVPVAFATAPLVVKLSTDRFNHILTGMVVPSLTTPLDATLIVWPRVVMAGPPAVNIVEPTITMPFPITLRGSESLAAEGAFVGIIVPSRIRPPDATL